MSARINSHIEVSSIAFDEGYSYKHDCNIYAVTFKYVYDDPKLRNSDPDGDEYIFYIDAADELDAMVKFKNRRLTNLEQ
jgi:hypothetical protein